VLGQKQVRLEPWSNLLEAFWALLILVYNTESTSNIYGRVIVYILEKGKIYIRHKK
jgi:hypothetical protein